MPLTQFIPIRYTFFLILGIVFGDLTAQYTLLGFWISAPCLLVLACIRIYKRRLHNLTFEIVTAICLIGVGMSAMALQYEPTRPDHYSRQLKEDAVLWLKIQEELRSGTYTNRFIAKLYGVNNSYASGKILLYSPDTIHFRPDTKLLVTKAWQPIRLPMNPGQFNYRTYMARQGIHDEIRLDGNDYLLLKNSAPTLMGRLRKLRQDIGHRLREAGLSPATVATTEALLLGERQHLDTNLYDAYKDAGAVHILAVSGLHIGILVLILKFLFQPLRRMRNGDMYQFLVIIALLWSYALFTGMSPSVVRAVALFSFIGYAWMIRRPTNMYNTLALSFFFVLLLIRPAYLFQAGFQMSYAAVLAIIWIYPKFMNHWLPRSWFMKRLWQLLAVSISAQLGVVPISLYYFHQFPGLFFLSNVLILPFLGIILGMGILVIVLTQIDWQVYILISGYDKLIQTMNLLVEWIGDQELFIFRDVVIDLPRLVLLYGFIIMLLLFLERRRFKILVALAGIALLFQSWLSFQSYKQHRNASLYLMHIVKHTILLEQKSNTLSVYLDTPDIQYDRILLDYQMVSGKGTIQKNMLQNSYRWGDQHILIIDGSGIIPENEEEYTHILLIQSPRIHLEKVLRIHPKAAIIADGSNYPSLVRRWRESCTLLNRSFHYTGEDGAYQFRNR